MGTEFLFSRIAGGIGTYLIGTIADRHGLQLPMLAAVAVCLAAWGWTYARRARIEAAFKTAADDPQSASPADR